MLQKAKEKFLKEIIKKKTGKCFNLKPFHLFSWYASIYGELERSLPYVNNKHDLVLSCQYRL